MPSFVEIARLTAVLAACWFCGAPAAAKGLPRYGVFVYSNFCVSHQSGDLYGDRITLRKFADGDSLIYEYTDGSTHALVANAVTLDPGAGTLRFEVSGPGVEKAIVSAQFSRDGRHLTEQGMPFRGDTTLTLTRMADFGAAIPECKLLPRAQ